MQKIKRREIWVDNIKVVACILVAIGHFFMGMITAEMMPDSGLQKWFIQTIYYFHVPLFFIASGYLYQKVNCVTDVRSWGKNILKKLLTLGIPYFVFSFVTWALKTFFSSSVNTPLGGLADTLFIHPAAPYWYLYALFFVFLITPTFRNKKMAVVGLIIALALKSVEIFLGGCDIKLIACCLCYTIKFFYVIITERISYHKNIFYLFIRSFYIYVTCLRSYNY